jgi:hypothetical protein
LKGEATDIIIDETGDPKKGTHTDYVARQYVGRLGKVDNGIVSVNIYGLKDGIVFPLIFEIYKPKQRLQPGDKYQSKPQIAIALVKELVKLGLKIKRVLADSLYGESSTNLIGALTKYADIAKWWELICCVFLLISSLAPSPQPSKPVQLSTCQSELESYLATHPDWQVKSGWKSMLNNIQLLLVPLLAFNLVKPWFRVFNNSLLVSSFLTLISLVNLCSNAFLNRDLTTIHSFSSA